MRKLLRNILFAALTGLFFIINTGFTLSLHYCKMMNETSVSGCGMCEEPEVTDVVCSNEKSSSDGLSFSSIPHRCCQSILGSIAGTDQYLLNQAKSIVKSTQIDLISDINQDEVSLATLFPTFISDSSPPIKTKTKLFLSSHNFRI